MWAFAQLTYKSFTTSLFLVTPTITSPPPIVLVSDHPMGKPEPRRKQQNLGQNGSAVTWISMKNVRKCPQKYSSFKK